MYMKGTMLSMFLVAIIWVYKLQATYTKSEISFWTPSTVVFSQKSKGPYGDRKVDPEEEVPEEEQEEAGNLIKSSSWKLYSRLPDTWRVVYLYLYTFTPGTTQM